MIRLLPIALVAVLILVGLGYWRYSASKANLTTPGTEQVQSEGPIEVPKTLPEASIEDRVKELEDVVVKLVNQVNTLKPQNSQNQSSTVSDSKLAAVEAAVTELKARVSLLEKAAPAPVSSSNKYPLYIPVGSSGGPWASPDWNTLNEYEVSIDPGSYPGYSSMQLEVNFRLVEAAGTASVRLFNLSDNTSVSSQVDTTSTSFGLKTSSTFTLPAGSKSYKLQIKSSQNKDIFIQSARIKVTF